MALTACADNPEIIYRTPPLNEANEKRLSCQAYPEISEILADLPAHKFLSGSNGQAVITQGGHKWIRFDIANEREAVLIRFGEISGRSAHFECFDDLNWLARLWRDLGKDRLAD